MEDWQVRLFLEAQAELVRVEGMKAENAQRAQYGESMTYSEGHFEEKAQAIEYLSREIGNR